VRLVGKACDLATDVSHWPRMLCVAANGAQEDGSGELCRGVPSARRGVNRRLQRIERMIDWAPLAALVKPVRSGVRGRPSYPPRAMLKGLLLQRWYSLSDEGLEGGAVRSTVIPAVLRFCPRRRDPRRQNGVPVSSGPGRR
jgi:hypothetical protein